MDSNNYSKVDYTKQPGLLPKEVLKYLNPECDNFTYTPQNDVVRNNVAFSREFTEHPFLNDIDRVRITYCRKLQ